LRSSYLGTLLISVAIGLGLAGIFFSSLSWAVLSVAIISAYVYSRLAFSSELSRTSLQIERRIGDEMAYTGEPLSVKVEVLNRNSFPIRGSFEDVLPEGCVLADGSNRSEEQLPPRTMLTLSYSMLPEKRGPHLIPGMRLERTDAFGLLIEDQMIDQPTPISVHTKKSSFDAARRIAGREHLEFSGFARNPAIVLRELEFDGLREYVPGDRVRDIHWKSLSKLNKLMTKTYRKEGSLQTMILLDCSSSMRVKSSKVSKIDHALDISMQLSNVLLSSFHPAGAAGFDEVSVISKVMPALGRRQFEAIVRTLRKVPGSFKSTVVGTPAPAGPKLPEAANEHTDTEDQGEFLSNVMKMSSTHGRVPLGLGLEGVIKESVARGKGQEQLFVVISDLVSSRDAVITGAKVCHSTGNRMLVIHTYDDWYRQGDPRMDLSQMENLYGSLTESLKVEGELRSQGAGYIRIGPADSAARIIRTIRRGRA